MLLLPSPSTRAIMLLLVSTEGSCALLDLAFTGPLFHQRLCPIHYKAYDIGCRPYDFELTVHSFDNGSVRSL